MAAGDPVRLSQVNSTADVAATRIESPSAETALVAVCESINKRTRGVRGETWSEFNAPAGAGGSAGVYGVASGSIGNASGVRGVSLANDGVGILGQAFANTPPAGQQQNCAGVKGTCSSAASVGVQAENSGGGPAFKAGSPTQTTFIVETDFAKFTDRETAMWLVARLDGVLSLRRVRVLGKNSAGPGNGPFRMLVIPNDP
jgi:hypothetical protein